MPSFNTVTFALAGLIASSLLSVVVSGCGADQCIPGESRCDGPGITSCGTPGDITGGRSFTALSAGCGSDRCLDIVDHGLRTAVCTTTGTKDDRCTALSFGSICTDNRTFLHCELGYSSAEKTCGACVTSPGSSTSTALTICALEATENPACHGSSVGACDGNSKVDCLRGWVTARHPCEGDSPTCVISKTELSVDHAYCATNATCTDKDATHCDAGGVHGCVAGHLVSSTCGPTDQCVSYVTTALCEPKCKAIESSVCLDR